MTPRVSVVIPTYNRAARIGQAIASVQAQTWRDFELLVVDDGSTDDTRARLDEWTKREPRLRIVENRGPRGAGGARNAGIAKARAEYVAFLDSDDTWEPELLEHFLREAEDAPLWIGSDYAMVDHGQNRRQTMSEFLFGTMVPWWERHPPAMPVVDCARLRAGIHAIEDPRVLLGAIIGGYPCFCMSAWMARKSELEAAGGFAHRLKRTEDLDLLVRLLPRGRIRYVHRVLATYDVTGRDNGSGPRYAGQGSRAHDAYAEAWWHLEFLRTMPQRASLDAHQRAFVRERMGATRRRCGFASMPQHPLRAVGHYAFALASSPDQRRALRAEGRTYFSRPW